MLVGEMETGNDNVLEFAPSIDEEHLTISNDVIIRGVMDNESVWSGCKFVKFIAG